MPLVEANQSFVPVIHWMPLAEANKSFVPVIHSDVINLSVIHLDAISRS